MAAAVPGMWPNVPPFAWPALSLLGFLSAVLAASRLTAWALAVERTLQSLREQNRGLHLPDTGDPLFSRIFDACLALHSSAGNRQVRAALEERASPEAIDALMQARLKWTGGWAKAELPLFVSEPMAEDASQSEPSVLADAVAAQLDLLKRHGGILDGYRWGEVSAFWPPGAEAASRALSGALACRRALSHKSPTATALVLAHVSVGELVEGGLTLLGEDTAIARQYVKAARFLGASLVASEEIRKLTGQRFAWRRLGRFKLGWRRLELHEALGSPGGSEDGGTIPVPRSPTDAPPRPELAATYEQALAALEARNWGGSCDLFKECLRLEPSDGPSRVCLNFAQRFRNNPPPRTWDGTLVLGPEA